jgi:hypothetical protein
MSAHPQEQIFIQRAQKEREEMPGHHRLYRRVQDVWGKIQGARVEAGLLRESVREKGPEHSGEKGQPQGNNMLDLRNGVHEQHEVHRKDMLVHMHGGIPSPVHAGALRGK